MAAHTEPGSAGGFFLLKRSFSSPLSLHACYDCSNPIFGQTVNPYNPQKTSGGSSGGEGALIGGGGSILGIGSDIGGSIRIPASFCGICGFKPTTGRLSSQGIVPIYRGQKC
ncbi:hypothetical protein CHARACLAT_033551, partial [Characodon lateralis]|nr:hypothetical protein [Characodon lateralis]